MNLDIRLAVNCDQDAELLAEYCHKLARYDGHEANLDASKLKSQLFQCGSNVKAFLAFVGKEPVGFILMYECFSVYNGEKGFYVPGAFIDEEYRGKGYGTKLFRHAAKSALDNGSSFMNWLVDQNNDKAAEFYKRMNASITKDWSYVRLPKNALEEMVRDE